MARQRGRIGCRIGLRPVSMVRICCCSGGHRGSLTGLPLVAVSMKSGGLSASLNLRSRAAQSLTLFTTSVLIALLIAVPQHRVALGIDLVALAIAVGSLMVVLDRRAREGSRARGSENAGRVLSEHRCHGSRRYRRGNRGFSRPVVAFNETTSDSAACRRSTTSKSAN
jgi:hypothetical protein